MDARCFLAQNFDEIFPIFRRRGVLEISSTERELAERRIARWKKSPTFQDQPELLERYLESWNASENDLKSLLGATAANLSSLHGASVPDWWNDAKILLDSDTLTEKEIPKTFSRTLVIFWPLWRQAHSALSEFAERMSRENPSLLNPSMVVDCLCENLSSLLARLVQRTLVLEVHIARLERRLEGTTPEERYENFLDLLQDPNLRRSILLEYPLLLKDSVRIVQQWQNAAEEFLQRLSQDHMALGPFFPSRAASILVQARMTGDSHQNGRFVLLLCFECGTRLVYKPRPLSSDALFQEFLRWNNDHGQNPALKTHRILARDGYGWTEFVPFAECESQQGLKRFFQRQGSLLALLYAVGGSDMHRENLIADGENPVAIDLETLFRPDFKLHVGTTNSEGLVSEKLVDSVLSVGLLPLPTLRGGKASDISAFGADRVRDGVSEVEGLSDVGTDKVHVGKILAQAREILCQPSLNGIGAQAYAYRHEIHQGFSEAYERILRHRSELLSASGPLAGFRGIASRVVLRSSEAYDTMLRESTHPKLLRNAFERELHFTRLLDASNNSQLLQNIASSERKQLFRGDIPYFLCETGSRDLLGGDGRRIENALERSGWDLMVKRLERLGPHDLAFQTWLIDAAFYRDDIKETFTWRRPPNPPPQDFLGAARVIGDHLRKTSIRWRGMVTWPTLTPLLGTEGLYRVGTIDNSLYQGHSGIALFLAHLAELSGVSAYRALALDCLVTIESSLSNRKELGAFTGLGGLIFLYTQLATLWKDNSLLNRAEGYLEHIGPLIDQDEILDFIAGSAGCVPVLLGLASANPGSSARILAIRCGERILARAVGQKSGGITWPNLPMQRGFSHGLSGIAYALSELAAATKEDRFLEATRKAMTHERSLLTQGSQGLQGSQRIWADTPGGEKRLHWCHGAAGIALSRLAIWQMHKDENALADAKMALAELNSHSFALTASLLCHGDFGILEAWRAETEILGSDRSAENLRRADEAMLKDFQSSGWLTNLPADLAEPGLMTGLAGIGFGFLRPNGVRLLLVSQLR